MPYARHLRRAGILAAGLAAAALGMATSARAQSKTSPSTQSEAPPATNLYPGQAVEFSAPPAVAVSGGAQCDTNENIYLRYFPSVEIINQMIRERHSLVGPPLRKIMVDSRETLEFSAGPFQGYKRASSQGFYVTPNGDVYGLACGLGSDSEPKGVCAWLVTKYNDDASVDSTIKLSVPRGVNLQPSRFAAFLDGSLLVAGFSVDREKGMRPFTAIFDRSGDFLTDVTLPDDIAPAPAPHMAKQNSSGKAPASGPAAKAGTAARRLFTSIGNALVVGAPDGTIYLLRGGSPERLYAVSSTGKVLREQTITLPGQGLSPFDVSVTGQGDLFIYYPREGSGGESVLALVDPQTGKVISTYNIPRDAGTPACMTSGGEILFARESKSGHLEVVSYTPQ